MTSPSEIPTPTPVAAAGSPMPEEPPIRRTRTASITQSILDANPHYGVLAAAGGAVARAPSLKDLRRSSIGSSNSRGRRSSISGVTSPRTETGLRVAAIDEEEARGKSRKILPVASMAGGIEAKQDDFPSAEILVQDRSEQDAKHGWWQTTLNGLKVFWSFFTTPTGFFVTIYMLNVVAWGGMLFLLLCNAAPAMCIPDCNDINSPRRIWIEIDSQILNALFCVTGFGLVPWRFRDLFFLLRWRLFSDKQALHKLEVIHAGWFRGPSGVNAAHTATGQVAPMTKSWKMDYVVWLYSWNTFFQCALSGFMWGMNRYNRPSWSTGLFVALACIVAGMAGGQVWWETKQVKGIESERIVEKAETEGGKKEKVRGKGRKFWTREERNVIVINRLAA